MVRISCISVVLVLGRLRSFLRGKEFELGLVDLGQHLEVNNVPEMEIVVRS